MVATLTWNLDANGMTFATSFSITTQARRVRTGRIKFSCLGRLLWAGLFASVCSPPRLSTTQLTLATRSGHVSTGLGLSPVSFMSSSSHVEVTSVAFPSTVPRHRHIPASKTPLITRHQGTSLTGCVHSHLAPHQNRYDSIIRSN